MLPVEICKINTSSNDRMGSDEFIKLRQSCHLNVVRFNNEVNESI